MTGAGEWEAVGLLFVSGGSLFRRLVDAAKDWFAVHGDNYRGAGGTRSQANTTHHRVMLEILDSSRDAPAGLDVGSGTPPFYEYIVRQGHKDDIRYSGLDLSPPRGFPKVLAWRRGPVIR